MNQQIVWSPGVTLDDIEEQVIMYERFVLRWAPDVIARRHDTTLYRINKILKACIGRLSHNDEA